MGYLLLTISFVLGFVKKNSRVLSYALLGVLWVIFSLNTYNADYAGYEYLYNHSSLQVAGSNQEVGYLALVELSKALSFDYVQFKCLVGFICMILLYIDIHRYTNSVALIISLYAVLPFLYDVVQFRFFFASLIVLFFVRYLIEGSRLAVLKYIVGLAVASTIHVAAILYAVLLITKINRRYLPYVSVGLSLVLLILVYSGVASTFASPFMDATKMAVYFTTMAQFGFLTYWASAILIIIIIKGFRPSVQCAFELKEGKRVPLAFRQAKFVAFMDKLVYALLPMMALIPLSTTNFFRPIRCLFVFVYIYFSIVAFENKRALPVPEKRLFLLLVIVWIIYSFVFLYAGVWDIVVDPCLTYNLLWTS